MWFYEKRLEYPVSITTPNAKLAQFIMSQYGGPDGEINASLRYLSQRFAMKNRIAMATLTDVGTEELAHLEIVATIVHQLTRDLSMEEIEKSGLGPYYIDHTIGVWPQAAGGVPQNACELHRKLLTRFVFCVCGKLCISSVSVKLSAPCRKILTPRISMHLMPALMRLFPARQGISSE